MRDEIRRNMALFPMGIVTRLTDLTPRQIRYYEEQGLIQPQRTNGRQRLFSLNDVEKLLKIKSLIDKGLNIAGIKQVLEMEQSAAENITAKEMESTDNELSERELHQLLRKQLFAEGRPHQPSLIQGQLSRFFH